MMDGLVTLVVKNSGGRCSDARLTLNMDYYLVGYMCCPIIFPDLTAEWPLSRGRRPPF